MLPFHQIVADDFIAVNQLIVERLSSEVELVENIGQHLVEAGGKRLRPLMVLLTARSLDYPGRDHLTLAAIIEFIHTATLLHDDVVDASKLRRGRATANARWGNAPSVLVGDFLYSRAFQMMVEIGNMDIMAILSETTNRIAEGEVQQLVNAGNPEVSEDGYYAVIDKKTAVLFSAACEVAGVLAGVAPEQRQSLKAFGLHLGTAFQLVDDALDYSGDATELGKNPGDDLAEGRPTLPLIRAMAAGSGAQRRLVADALRGGRTDALPEILGVVRDTGALDYTLAAAGEQVDLALAALSTLPNNSYTQAMTQVAEFSLSRDF